jgi:hypothetical protein
LGYGHENLVLGCFAFLAALSLVLRIRIGRIGLTHACVAAAALIECLPSQGHQTILYSVVFGGPVCLALLLQKGGSASGRKAAWTVALLLLAAALGISMPKFAGMLAHALGHDTGRRLGGEAVVYSFTTSTLRDWLGSIPWGQWLIPNDRPLFLHHEVNYPLGPLLLILCLVPWKKMGAAAFVLPISAFLAIAFSMDLRPVSSILLKVVPPLNDFRVPARAILPFACLVPILSCAALIRRTQGRERPGWALLGASLILGILFLHAGPAVREVASWGASALVASQVFLPEFWSKIRARKALCGGAVVFLGVMNLSFFSDRLLPYAPERTLTYAPDKLGELVRSKDPSLGSPLTRILLKNNVEGLSINTPLAAGLSSLDGYGYPSKRFLDLLSSLSNQKFPTTSDSFQFDETNSTFPILRTLYDIKFAASLDGDQVSLRPLGPTAGPAWFAPKLEPVPDFAELGRRLMGDRGSAVEAIRCDALVVASDPSTPALVSGGAFEDSRCARSEVVDTRYDTDGQTLHITARNPAAACPLVVSTNFVDIFQATDESPGANAGRLTTFPAYGALTGIWVPAGVSAIRLRPAPVLPLWASLAQAAGCLAFAAAVLLIQLDRELFH